MNDGPRQFVDLFISDRFEFGKLRDLMASAAPDVRISISSTMPEPGEQGALDMLVLAGSGGGVLAAIRVIPEFLKARRTAISITVKAKEKTVIVTASNVDEVMPIIERILDA